MKKKSKKLFLISAGAIIVVIVVFVVMFSGSGNENGKRSTVKVEKKTIIEKALAVGSIEPMNEIEVKSKISGVVGKLYVEVGDFVRAGAPLLEVKPDPTPLELAQAKRDVEMTSLEMKGTAKALERTKKLKMKGMVSDQEFESILKQYEEAKLRNQIAKERLELLEVGKINIEGTEIEAVVKAPLTGFILEKYVNPGDPVVPLTSYQPGTSLMRMANMDHLIFKGTVDEIDVGKIKEGLPCELQVGALPGKIIKGHVTLISLKAKKEDNTTVFPVEIKIDEIGNTMLRAGYSANAHIIIAKRDSVLAVPERVVTFRNDSAFVKIPVGEKGQKEKYIKTGLSDAIYIEVIEGLKEGDEVLEKETKEII